MAKRGRVSGGGETAEDRIRLIVNDRDKRIAELEAAITNIKNFIRDRSGTDWDGVRSFCKQALAAKEK